MHIYDTRNNQVLTFNNTPHKHTPLTNRTEPLHVNVDSEYTDKDELNVDSVQVAIPELSDKVFVALDKNNDIGISFNPIFSGIEQLGGYKLSNVSENDLYSWGKEVRQVIDEICGDEIDNRTKKRLFKKAIEKGKFDNLLKEYNLSRTQLVFKKGELSLDVPEIKVDLIAHYMPADLFKIFGKNWHGVLLKSPLVQNRTLSFFNHQYIHLAHVMLDNTLCKIVFTLRDTMYRIPPKSKALGVQCEIFEADVGKLDDESIDKCNMSKMYWEQPELTLQYAALDPVATAALDQKQREYIGAIYKSFGLLPPNDISVMLRAMFFLTPQKIPQFSRA